MGEHAFLQYWFLFPIGVLVAGLSMSSGIAGSNFWIPIYLLWLGLDPRVAFWVALLTMLFGSGSGMVRNLRAGTVGWNLVGRYATPLLLATGVGALWSARAPTTALLLAFAAFAAVYGVGLALAVAGDDEGSRLGIGTERTPWPLAVLAGTLHGSIATGAGALLMPALLRHRGSEHHARAIGSTVVLVFFASLVSVALRLDAVLLRTLLQDRSSIAAIMVFAAPGVLVGGQLGPRLAERLPRRYVRRYVGALLVAVGALVALRGLALA